MHTDMGTHYTDQMQWVLGTDTTGPVEFEIHDLVWPDPARFMSQTAISGTFRCRYANGVRMIGTTESPRGLRFEGTEGWIFIHVHGGNLEAEPASLLQSVIGPNEIHLGRSRGHHYDFIECVKSRGETKAPVEVGYHTATMCHMANIAMLLGKKLHWDPVAERFDDDAANRMMQPSMRAPWII